MTNLIIWSCLSSLFTAFLQPTTQKCHVCSLLQKYSPIYYFTVSTTHLSLGHSSFDLFQYQDCLQGATLSLLTLFVTFQTVTLLFSSTQQLLSVSFCVAIFNPAGCSAAPFACVYIFCLDLTKGSGISENTLQGDNVTSRVCVCVFGKASAQPETGSGCSRRSVQRGTQNQRNPRHPGKKQKSLQRLVTLTENRIKDSGRKGCEEIKSSFYQFPVCVSTHALTFLCRCLFGKKCVCHSVAPVHAPLRWILLQHGLFLSCQSSYGSIAALRSPQMSFLLDISPALRF